jgi:hypothetical protein
VARAEALGGLAMSFDGHHVRVVDIPDMQVVIHTTHRLRGPERTRENGIGLTDYSADAFPLMTLLEHALVDLGGEMDRPPLPLSLPLTADDLRRERLKARRTIRFGCLAWSLALLLAAALLVGLAWGAWRGLQWLAGG